MPLFLAYPTSLEVLRLFRAGFADNGLPVDTEARSPFPGSPSLFEHIPSNEAPRDGEVECFLRTSHPLWDEVLAKPLTKVLLPASPPWHSCYFFPNVWEATKCPAVS